MTRYEQGERRREQRGKVRAEPSSLTRPVRRQGTFKGLSLSVNFQNLVNQMGTYSHGHMFTTTCK